MKSRSRGRRLIVPIASQGLQVGGSQERRYNKLELLLAESLRVAHQSGALRTRDLKRVTVDTTVQPKAITFRRSRLPGHTAQL